MHLVGIRFLLIYQKRLPVYLWSPFEVLYNYSTAGTNFFIFKIIFHYSCLSILYNVECSSKYLINGKMLLRGKIDLSTLGPPNGGMKSIPFLPWAVWQLLPSGEYYFPENTIIGNFDKKYTHTLVSIVAGVQKYVILMNISV